MLIPTDLPPGDGRCNAACKWSTGDTKAGCRAALIRGGAQVTLEIPHVSWIWERSGNVATTFS